MKRLPLVSIGLLICVLSSSAFQRPRLSQPGGALQGTQANSIAEPVTLQKHIDLVQLQQEADDLARTAQTIPLDMANVRKGMLPKDFILKLKQIEKLSKHLRSEISR